MDLSILFSSLNNALTNYGWLCAVENDYPDLKQLTCINPLGPFEFFTRIDVLIMTPELIPEKASGVIVCFIYYADPSKTTDMRKCGKEIRRNDFELLSGHSGSILNAVGIELEHPSITMVTRPKGQKIYFNAEKAVCPAFMVELGYWLQGTAM